MKVRKLLALLLSALLLLALAGCGAGSMKTEAAYDMAAPQEAGNGMYMMSGTTADNSLTEESAASAQVPESRKWIVTVDMSAETEDMDSLIAGIQEQIDALGGYVQNQRISNGSYRASYRYRNANLTVRIPAESVDQFTEKVSGMSNVTHSSKNLEDITLSYVATESRMLALQTEEARLLELMAKAETMSDLLEIEARLTDVRYELERVTSQLRSYDDLVNYATIYLNIEEVKEYTPVAEKTRWQKITDGFVKSLKGVWNGTLDFFAWLLINIPYLLVFGAIGFVAIRLIRKARKKKKARKAQMPMPQPEKKDEKSE
jgi:hypothetical protein